jgi:hypothetical protein
VGPINNNNQGTIAGIIRIRTKDSTNNTAKIKNINIIRRLIIRSLRPFTNLQEDLIAVTGLIFGNVTISSANMLEIIRYSPAKNNNIQIIKNINFSGKLAAIPLLKTIW